MHAKSSPQKSRRNFLSSACMHACVFLLFFLGTETLFLGTETLFPIITFITHHQTMSSRNVLRRGLKTSSSFAQSLPALKERSAAAATTKPSIFSQIFGGSATKQPPMDEPMPNVIIPESPIYPKEAPKTLVTTLSNGATIASENTPGATMAVGLYLESGSKYEQPYMSGASHML